MRSSAYYQILSLTTVAVVSILATSDGSNSNAGDEIQSLMNFLPGGQSQLDDEPALGFDSKDAIIKGLGEDDADNNNDWTELQFQQPPPSLLAESNNNDHHGCTSSRANKKRRRGNTDYCSPINAPPLHFQGPSSQQEDPQTGSSKKAPEGSPTEPGQQQSNPNPQTDEENLLAPPSSTSGENNCPARYRIPICATTRLEPDPTQEGGWRREPWDESATSDVLFQQDYCRIWYPQARCETESEIEHFMCCRSVKPIVLDSPISIFDPVMQEFLLRYPKTGFMCILAIEPIAVGGGL